MFLLPRAPVFRTRVVATTPQKKAPGEWLLPGSRPFMCGSQVISAPKHGPRLNAVGDQSRHATSRPAEISKKGAIQFETIWCF